MPERIYFDNAATSWPKPEQVYEAIERYQRENGAAAGRASYRHASDSGKIVDQARQRVGQLLHAERDAQVCFAFNGTDALNLAIHGLLKPGDHVVTTELEHNSVLRPLQFLVDQSGLHVDYARPDEYGRISPQTVRSLLRDDTRAVVMSHASNVTGVIQPIEEIARFCRSSGVLFILDAAQTVGHRIVDVTTLGVDVLAASGHKGLLGPLGTGVLYLARSVHELIRPLRQGGTGSRSQEAAHPNQLPDRLEAGNSNVLGLAGLVEGAAYVEANIDAIIRHESALVAQLTEGLSEISSITSFGNSDRVGVISFVSAAYDPHELAALLDVTAGIEVRAGLHCAPKMHRRLGTAKTGGTVRVSLGPFNTHEQIAKLLAVLKDIH